MKPCKHENFRAVPNPKGGRGGGMVSEGGYYFKRTEMLVVE